MKARVLSSIAVAVLVGVVVLASSVVPGHAAGRGGGGWRGQGSSWSGHQGGHGWQGRSGHWGHHHFGGGRVFFGVGLAPLWYPYGYAYGYPYYYPYPAYSQPVVVESGPPTYIEQNVQAAPQQPYAPQSQQYWYYCQSSQTYYPYVKECPSGWLQVVPQSTPPPR